MVAELYIRSNYYHEVDIWGTSVVFPGANDGLGYPAQYIAIALNLIHVKKQSNRCKGYACLYY